MLTCREWCFYWKMSHIDPISYRHYSFLSSRYDFLRKEQHENPMAFQRAIFLHSQYSHFVSLHNGYFICHITQNRNYSERERRQSHDFVRTVFSHLLASFGVYSFNFCEIIFISFWFEWEKWSRLNRNRSQNWKHFVVCGSHISIHLVEAKNESRTPFQTDAVFILLFPLLLKFIENVSVSSRFSCPFGTAVFSLCCHTARSFSGGQNTQEILYKQMSCSW